jgi:hypothetical protein
MPGDLSAIDGREWVPQTADVSFRPLLLNVSQGQGLALLHFSAQPEPFSVTAATTRVHLSAQPETFCH